MAGCVVVLCFTVLVCQVHSQLCPPILPPPCPAPCVPQCPPIIPPCPTNPQIINPNPYVTTIIDTSVSNGLVNALQLLIVSNLIGTTLGAPTPLVDTLGPLLDSLLCQNPYPVEVVIPEYLSCGPGYDLIPPYYPSSCSYYDFIPPISPVSIYPPTYEVFPPCSIIDPYPPFCGYPDVISPNYFAYTETITPICSDSPYNGYNDLLLPITGIDANFYGLNDIIPNYINYPIPEVYPFNPYCPAIDPIPPTVCPFNPYCPTIDPIPPTVCSFNSYCPTIDPIPPTLCPFNPYYPAIDPIPPTVLPNMFGCLNEFVAPLSPAIYAPEPLGLTVPLSPEVLYPPVQAPVPCNYGFSPSSLPSVKVLDSYDNCLYNSYPGPIYY